MITRGLTNNTAVYGGGVSISATTATLTNNSITSNTTTDAFGEGGGAIRVVPLVFGPHIRDILH